MKRIFTVFIILVFILAIGCSKPEPAPQPTPQPAPPKPAPKLTQIQPEPETVAPETKTEEKKEAPIGTRVGGTQKEAVNETVPDEGIEIKLSKDKTMNATSLTVKKGDTVFWKNYDSWPHQLAVETGKGFDTTRHAQSKRLLEGGAWNYTFNEKGTFLVRDIYSGGMRMTVTVD